MHFSLKFSLYKIIDLLLLKFRIHDRSRADLDFNISF